MKGTAIETRGRFETLPFKGRAWEGMGFASGFRVLISRRNGTPQPPRLRFTPSAGNLRIPSEESRTR
ncbi:MAG: hypothetical protein AMXMBFR59_38090 [Rhodanobacteraceae bacterium]